MVGIFCTKEKGTGNRSFKRSKPRSIKAGYRLYVKLLTQVNKGRVQVICEIVNPGQ